MKNKIEVIASKRGYIVDQDGKLYNPKGYEIGKSLDKGYYYTRIRIKGISKRLKVHRLQAYQKYSNNLFEKGTMTRHLNGNSLDNSWDNIAIGTASDNTMDIPEQIRIKRAKHATSFIRKYNKEEVRTYHKKSKSYKKTMEYFNISSKGTLHFILNK